VRFGARSWILGGSAERNKRLTLPSRARQRGHSSVIGVEVGL
jgi:hypothetical protein